MHAVWLILLIFGWLVAALFLVAALKRNRFRIERKVSIRARPETVFPLINNLRGFNVWNPYLKMDPAARQTYGAIDEGNGASYAWESAKTGVGSMEIIESIPPTKVLMKLEFVKPFRASNFGEFTLSRKGGSCEVTWAMHGPKPFMTRLMTMFFSMDKMVGREFSKGLAGLKALAEK